jgi:hypothetical protein
VPYRPECVTVRSLPLGIGLAKLPSAGSRGLLPEGGGISI